MKVMTQSGEIVESSITLDLEDRRKVNARKYFLDNPYLDTKQLTNLMSIGAEIGNLEKMKKKNLKELKENPFLDDGDFELFGKYLLDNSRKNAIELIETFRQKA